MDAEFGALANLQEIDAIGHRMVHGGESFKQSVLITEEVKSEFKRLTELAPLHNPANLMGVEACEKILPGVPNVAVFDTAFHQTMKPEHFLYALPYRRYEEHKVRRYGFHGTSHKYVSQRMAEIAGRSDLKIITCHVGNGASITAIKNGEVVETSMGLTPLEGVIMGTRCGNIDPAIVPFMMKKENLTAEQIDAVMNKQSGILGLLGTSSDHREIEDGYLAGKEKETMIMHMYTNAILKYIGSYAALLGGVDAIGHRMVHGGESFKQSVLITEEVKSEFKRLIELAPLHNPANLMGVEACEKILPGVPNVAVFDTAFHQTMKPEHFLYALPYRRYEEHKVRRYGFHGTSHKYVSQRMAELAGRSDLRIITCHVGN